MKNKNLLRLKKAYRARFKILNNKKFIGDIGVGILAFVEQLKYLRDILITESLDAPINDTEIIEPFPEFNEQIAEPEIIISSDEEALATLLIAIAEFECYQSSDDTTQKNFHFNNFWESVKINIDRWLALNDTI